MAVEAALVTSFILIPIICGIIEFSFALRDYVSVTSASRSGARAASANANAGTQVCDAGESGSCAYTTVPQLAKLAVNAVAAQGTALSKQNVNYVLVYKANANGFPGTLAGWSSAPQTDCKNAGSCVSYSWDSTSQKFKYQSAYGTWTSTTINACASTADSVGVYLNVLHPYVTGLFGRSVTIADRTVMKFEPLTSDVCAPGNHS